MNHPPEQHYNIFYPASSRAIFQEWIYSGRIWYSRTYSLLFPPLQFFQFVFVQMIKIKFHFALISFYIFLFALVVPMLVLKAPPYKASVLQAQSLAAFFFILRGATVIHPFAWDNLLWISAYNSPVSKLYHVLLYLCAFQKDSRIFWQILLPHSRKNSH